MTETERQVRDLTISIDRSECVGYGHCLSHAGDAFELGDDDVVLFRSPERVDRDTLIDACRKCPVGALSVLDADGAQLAPDV